MHVLDTIWVSIKPIHSESVFSRLRRASLCACFSDVKLWEMEEIQEAKQRKMTGKLISCLENCISFASSLNGQFGPACVFTAT